MKSIHQAQFDIEDRIEAAKLKLEIESDIVKTASKLFFVTLWRSIQSSCKATWNLAMLLILSALWVPVAVVAKALK